MPWRSAALTLILALISAAAAAAGMAAAQPKLTVGFWEEPGPHFPGGNLTVHIWMENDGPGSAWVDSITLYLDDLAVGELDLGGLRLEPGENRSLGAVVGTVPEVPPGNHGYHLLIRYRYPGEGGEGREEWITEEYGVTVSGRPRVSIDWEILGNPEEVPAGGEIQASVRVENRWDWGVTLGTVLICPDWIPGDACILKELNSTLDPGTSADLGPYGIDLPENLDPGLHRIDLSLEFSAGESRVTVSPDYFYTLEVVRPGSPLEGYKEIVGIVAGTAGAIGGVYGVYSKLRSRGGGSGRDG